MTVLLDLKSKETKRAICTLHYLGASLNDRKIIKFINAFVDYKLDGRSILQSDFSSNGIKIIRNFVPSVEFMNVYKLFATGNMNEHEYYAELEYLKKEVLKMITLDIMMHYKIGANLDFNMARDIIGRLIKFDLQNPFKYQSVAYKTNYDKNFLNEFHGLYTMNSDEPYYYVQNNEVTLKINDNVINVLNSHLSSKHRVPKYSAKNLKDVRSLLHSLKNDVEEWNHCIFIVPPCINKIRVHGKEFVKTESNTVEVKCKKDVSNTIVTDSYITLNNPIAKKYKQFIVDMEGNVKRYINESGTFHNEGIIHVE